MTDQIAIHSNDVPITNADGVKAIFANDFVLTWTNTDMTLHMLEIGTELGQPNVIFHQVRAIVKIPSPIASRLGEAIQQIFQAARDQMRNVSQLQDGPVN